MLSGVNTAHKTATGTVVGSDLPQAYCGAILTSGSAAATATIRRGSASGDIIALIKAANGESEVDHGCEIALNGDMHVTLAGTGATIDIRWK